MTQLRTSRATLWIVLAHLAIVVPLAIILNVWQDEAYSLLTTGGSLGHAIHQAMFFEQNAPLYFIVLWLWRQISGAYWWARIFSIGCTAATIALVPALVRRYAPQVSPLYVTLAVAFNPFTIWAAVEMRAYALTILLGALVMLTAYDAFAPPKPRLRDLIAFVAVGTIAAYTQYFILFLVMGCGIVLLLLRSWKALTYYVACGIAMLVLFVPMLLVLPTQLSAFRGAYLGPANLPQAFEQLGKIFFFQLFPVEELPHRGAVGAAIFCLIFVGLVLGRKHFARGGPYLAPLLLAASALVFTVAVYALKSHFNYRYGAFLFIPLMVAAYSALGWWSQPARQRALATATAALLAISAVALVVTYRSGAKAGDWQRVAAYLQSSGSNAPIVVFQAENAIPLAYYYHGTAGIVALPRAVDLQSYDVDRFVVRGPQDVRATLARAGNPREFWLVKAGGCHSLNVVYGCNVVDAYVASHYRTVAERRFYRATVRLLQRSDDEQRRR
jgi:uncharacterized membrane protein